MTTLSAISALERLREGNRRFVSDDLHYCGMPSIQKIRYALATGQDPFAIIIGCSDSRVPTEIIFDQDLGDLFVIRVAGNIVGPSQVGSVEFAAAQFATQLVVVLGHTRCGAVSATIEEIQDRAECRSPSLCSITDRIRPSVEAVLDLERRLNPDDLLRRAVRSNIKASVNHLRHGSPILEQLILDNQLVVVGAEYSVKTGTVDFFDGLTGVI